ncbi:hypothetical protein LJR235_004663 [Pararhizobium sp. LjRoot235]|uniref:TetR/AcrR family transcriptional regulator n=1 Tax=Pararhizobium sp. LjRoot235 TaxID=3342291 RepID=UPI003ED12102
MRKQPRQARSRATRNDPLGWCSSDEGPDLRPTGSADLARVIGSPYQYFPDKLSLVDAICRRHLDGRLVVVRNSKTPGLSPMQFVANLVRAMIAVHSIYPGPHRVLFDESPSSGDYRNPNSEFEFEIEYLGYYAEASCRNR